MNIRREKKRQIIALLTMLRTKLMTAENRINIEAKLKQLRETIRLSPLEADPKEIEHRRNILKENTSLQEVFAAFWLVFSLYVDPTGVLSKDGYVKFHESLQYALIGDIDENIHGHAEEDWAHDTAMFGPMNRLAFFDALFETIETWSELIEPTYYAAFAWCLLDSIADTRVQPPRLRPRRLIRCITKFESEATMTVNFIKDKKIRSALSIEASFMSRAPQVKQRLAARRYGVEMIGNDANIILTLTHNMPSPGNTSLSTDSDTHSIASSAVRTSRDEAVVVPLPLVSTDQKPAGNNSWVAAATSPEPHSSGSVAGTTHSGSIGHHPAPAPAAIPPPSVQKSLAARPSIFSLDGAALRSSLLVPATTTLSFPKPQTVVNTALPANRHMKRKSSIAVSTIPAVPKYRPNSSLASTSSEEASMSSADAEFHSFLLSASELQLRAISKRGRRVGASPEHLRPVSVISSLPLTVDKNIESSKSRKSVVLSTSHPASRESPPRSVGNAVDFSQGVRNPCESAPTGGVMEPDKAESLKKSYSTNLTYTPALVPVAKLPSLVARNQKFRAVTKFSMAGQQFLQRKLEEAQQRAAQEAARIRQEEAAAAARRGEDDQKFRSGIESLLRYHLAVNRKEKAVLIPSFDQNSLQHSTKENFLGSPSTLPANSHKEAPVVKVSSMKKALADVHELDAFTDSFNQEEDGSEQKVAAEMDDSAAAPSSRPASPTEDGGGNTIQITFSSPKTTIIAKQESDFRPPSSPEVKPPPPHFQKPKYKGFKSGTVLTSKLLFPPRVALPEELLRSLTNQIADQPSQPQEFQPIFLSQQIDESEDCHSIADDDRSETSATLSQLAIVNAIRAEKSDEPMSETCRTDADDVDAFAASEKASVGSLSSAGVESHFNPTLVNVANELSPLASPRLSPHSVASPTVSHNKDSVRSQDSGNDSEAVGVEPFNETRDLAVPVLELPSDHFGCDDMLSPLSQTTRTSPAKPTTLDSNDVENNDAIMGLSSTSPESVVWQSSVSFAKSSVLTDDFSFEDSSVASDSASIRSKQSSVYYDLLRQEFGKAIQNLDASAEGDNADAISVASSVCPSVERAVKEYESIVSGGAEASMQPAVHNKPPRSSHSSHRKEKRMKLGLSLSLSTLSASASNSLMLHSKSGELGSSLGVESLSLGGLDGGRPEHLLSVNQYSRTEGIIPSVGGIEQETRQFAGESAMRSRGVFQNVGGLIRLQHKLVRDVDPQAIVQENFASPSLLAKSYASTIPIQTISTVLPSSLSLGNSHSQATTLCTAPWFDRKDLIYLHHDRSNFRLAAEDRKFEKIYEDLLPDCRSQNYLVRQQSALRNAFEDYADQLPTGSIFAAGPMKALKANLRSNERSLQVVGRPKPTQLPTLKALEKK